MFAAMELANQAKIMEIVRVTAAAPRLAILTTYVTTVNPLALAQQIVVALVQETQLVMT